MFLILHRLCLVLLYGALVAVGVYVFQQREWFVPVIDHLEVDLDSKMNTAQNLRQAILRHAFTGQLVPQDPNDEPAELLLERIKIERAKREAVRQAASLSRRKRKPAVRQAASLSRR